jgi:hypothetical protein
VILKGGAARLDFDFAATLNAAAKVRVAPVGRN